MSVCIPRCRAAAGYLWHKHVIPLSYVVYWVLGIIGRIRTHHACYTCACIYIAYTHKFQILYFTGFNTFSYIIHVGNETLKAMYPMTSGHQDSGKTDRDVTCITYLVVLMTTVCGDVDDDWLDDGWRFWRMDDGSCMPVPAALDDVALQLLFSAWVSSMSAAGAITFSCRTVAVPLAAAGTLSAAAATASSRSLWWSLLMIFVWTWVSPFFPNDTLCRREY